MVILVTNKTNNRRCALKIPYDELVNGDGKGKKWGRISTPVILSQDDPESGQELEEKFCSVLASIGAVYDFYLLVLVFGSVLLLSFTGFVWTVDD